MTSNTPTGGTYLQPTRSPKILFDTAPKTLPKYLVQRGPAPSPLITGTNDSMIPPATDAPIPTDTEDPVVLNIPNADNVSPRSPRYLIAGAATHAQSTAALIDVFGVRKPNTYHVVGIPFEVDEEAFREAFTETITHLVLASSRLHPNLQVATVTFESTPSSLDEVGIRGFTDHAIGQFWKGSDLVAKDDDGRTVFSRSVVNGNLDLAGALAQFAEVDVNTQDNNGRTPLHLACFHRHPEVVQFLLVVPGVDAGLQSNARETAFDMARKKKDEVVGLLFMVNVFEMNENNPDDALARTLTMSTAPYHPSAPPHNPADMFPAAKKGHATLVKALIFAGVDVNTADAEQVTGLGFAGMEGHPGVAGALLQTPGIDVNRADVRGFTALHYACRGAVPGAVYEPAERDWIGVVRLLIAAEGVDLNLRTGAGKTAKQIAQDAGHQDIVDLLPA